jgi:hypothetical protein
MREPALVADPGLVDVGVVAGEVPDHFAPAQVDPDGASAAQCGQIESPEATSKGRAANRYVVEVSAPTGQIWMVLPENGHRKSSPGAIETCSAAPRSNSSMKRSPEI